MSRLAAGLAALLLLTLHAAAQGQVVDTSPAAPVAASAPVTITFHADRGNGGLEDCGCEVWAHTGLITSESAPDEWRYIMDNWPDNRPKTKLTKTGPNTYQLQIDDIRAYYSDNNTGFGAVPPPREETIERLAFVFRNADGSQQGKTAEGGNIYVAVNDTGTDPFLSATLQTPSADPPLYPFVVAQDTTVDVTVAADTANVDAFDELRLLVDGTPVATTTETSLTHPLPLTEPGRRQIRVEARATIGDSTLTDAVETLAIRTPDVTDAPRPPGTQTGVTYHADGSATLSLFAPAKEFVYAIGDFSGWDLDNRYFLNREVTDRGAYWWITLDGIQGPTDFQYYVGGASRDIRINDPFSRQVRTPADDQISEAVYPGLAPYPGDQTEGLVSVLRPSAAQETFSFSDFEPPAKEDLVIYELLVRDFLETSSFRALTDTLSYLDRLGVNAVELLPLSNFEGHGVWGYRPNAHLALDKSYGPPEDFKRFVEAAHSRGMAVIVDVVYNHITASSALARLYDSADANPFLESGPNRGICGAFFLELNQGSPFIQEYIRRANRRWLEDFNVDGFRFDVAHCVADDGVNINDPGHSDALRRGWQAVADAVWSVNPDAYMTLELFGAPEVANDLGSYQGQGTPGGMLTWHRMSDRYSRADRGNLQDGSDLSASYFGFRGGVDQPSGITYMTSHDEQWLMRSKKARGTGTDAYSTQDFATALDRQKLSGAFFFTVPGPRLMWQFEEVGYGWGTDECLRPFAGEDLCPPGAPIRIGPKPVRWGYADSTQSPLRDQLFKTWKALIRLRNDHEVFSRERGVTNPDEGIQMRVGSGDAVRCIRLEDEALDALVVGNFGLSRQTVTLGVGADAGACSVPQTGTWHNFFESDTLQVDRSRRVALRPGEFRIYTSEAQDPPPMGLVPSAPTARATQRVSADGTYDFGGTGIGLDVRGVGGSGDLTAEKLTERPLGPDGIGEGAVSDYRFVLRATGDLRFTDETTIRLDAGALGGVADARNVVVYRRPTEDTGTFTRLETSYDGDADVVVAQTGGLGEFVLASDTETLPVELADFSARRAGERSVELTWRTASETNNAGFRVQRRTGAAAWTDRGFVEGAGTTQEAQTYRFADDAPFAADSVQYRLQQVDVSGRTHVTSAVTVTLGAPTETRLAAPYPNPATGQATVRYAVPTRTAVRLELYDVLGRRVQTVVQRQTDGRHEHTLDVSGLSSGVYVLRLQAGDQTRTRRLTVVR